jgi:hypothetical protein
MPRAIIISKKGSDEEIRTTFDINWYKEKSIPIRYNEYADHVEIRHQEKEKMIYELFK